MTPSVREVGVLMWKVFENEGETRKAWGIEALGQRSIGTVIIQLGACESMQVYPENRFSRPMAIAAAGATAHPFERG